MKVDCSYIAYEETGYFSRLVTDYLKNDEKVKPFFAHPVTKEGFKEAIESRKQFQTDRKLLVDVLQEQYKGLELSPVLKQNLSLLTDNNTFTITTAHQPNIFTGPLYFIYKILHAVKLAQELAVMFPGMHFVPVYYMGSEDADLEELGSITISGKKYTWHTAQTGAVGRMKVDKALLSLLDEMQGQVGVLPYGKEIVDLFRKNYTIGATIQQATLQVVNELFGRFGLVVVIPDNALLKGAFNKTITKELTEEFSHKAVAATIRQLEESYKVQAGGRELNLFYLVDDKRERIEKEDEKFVVKGLRLQFSQSEILEELRIHPERFSANVILRGVFQETILPNIAFIGGGGELAYWLELKGVFHEAAVPYPVLILRNSFLVIEHKWQEMINSLQLSVKDLFKPENELLNAFVHRHSQQKLSLENEVQRLQDIYNDIQKAATAIDFSLQQHINALQTQTIKKIQKLEKKMLRAEKRHFETEANRLHSLKQQLFPNNSLQERVENIAFLYGKYGNVLLDMLLAHSQDFKQEFAICAQHSKHAVKS